jgi:dTDP-glucose 4,6-dehydratase
MNVLVTGALGFIGSTLVRLLRREKPAWAVTTLDAVTYAADPEALASLAGDGGHHFERGDVGDRARVEEILRARAIEVVFHVAAETHVDRSIAGPAAFITTNVLGTQVLLDAARANAVSRVVLVSTDEVYGPAGPTLAFRESAPLHPSSPYAASKAASDLLALSYHRTYGLDVVITRCSNNYGPRQLPEKLIPRLIVNALRDQALPLYGDGRQVRDWLFVEDHCRGLLAALERGRSGEVYHLGGGAERENLQVAHAVLRALGKPPSLIQHVADRPGHDRRYALDAGKAASELGWRPGVGFDAGLDETVRWYAGHRAWWERAIERLARA